MAIGNIESRTIAPGGFTTAGGLRIPAFTPVTSAGAEIDFTAATPAGENVIGQVGTPGDVISFTATLDTSIYADGDLLFDATEIANFVRVNGGRAIIQSLTLIDKDDQGVAMDIFTSPVTVDFGTVNSASSISDADAILGVQRLCRIETTDYIDLGGCRVATVKNLGLMVEADTASRSIFLAAITRAGTPTYTAAGLVFRFGLIWF